MIMFVIIFVIIYLHNIANFFSSMAVIKVAVPIVISLLSLGVAFWSRYEASKITKKQRRLFFKIINKGDMDSKPVVKWHGDLNVRVQNIGLNSASNIIVKLTVISK